ncbi:MAG: NTP transferase domain-containing protein [Saprospiraceae bacterium]|nr:NTP transferase domain-containing protein [Saprospiraceae bacterium]HMW38444.1 sugar phosphate nucleotidyltransferase [Saprospiraceae bacterium]HMX87586.1 sugar phosphate nucleotidyltransferase [Saprospiraceae bacterium]HMZ40907.1 sugar phosphate nucleotidyltransferase [Saprospiraceae bacterium]HNA65042.1 sugar phosphate nucleotidyltransferase [Saprospiraceae bacterium]
MQNKLRECIILAGGLGTRLNHLIPGVPKSLAPVSGKPFLKYLLDYLQSQETDHFIFSLGYLHHQIIEFLDTEAGHLHKTYIIEEKPLGTGGAIINAMRALNSDYFFVVNADTFYPVDLNHILNFHIQNNADITLALKPMLQPFRYGTVTITSN